MKNLLKVLLFSSILIIGFSCNISKKPITITKQAEDEFIKSNQYAFIEFIQIQEGLVLEGNALEGRRIDGPTYRFDKETMQLESYRELNFSFDTVKAILGNGVILKGAAGSGVSLRLSAISKFPYTMNKLTILGISSKGLSIVFDEKEQLVKEGEQWETSSTNIDTLKYGTHTIIKYTTTSSIRYHGLIDKNRATN